MIDTIRYLAMCWTGVALITGVGLYRDAVRQAEEERGHRLEQIKLQMEKELKSGTQV